jgi:hypothetical protein
MTRRGEKTCVHCAIHQLIELAKKQGDGEGAIIVDITLALAQFIAEVGSDEDATRELVIKTVRLLDTDVKKALAELRRR